MICLILVAQKALGNKLGPRWSHALWLVLLIRMVMPWAPPSRISLLSLLPSSVRQGQLPPVSDLGEQELGIPSATVPEAAKATAQQEATPGQSVQRATPPKPQALARVEQPPGPAFLTLRQILPVLWLAGAALVGAHLCAGNFALWRIVKRERPVVDQSTLELFEECKTLMGVQTLVAAIPTSQIEGPALFGFIRPRLLLPRQMLDTASRDEMRYVFLHELAHLKRHDIYLGWATSLLQVLHWFNPLVWFAFHRMRTDRELACDALVLACTGQQESQEYGRAIVALLRRFSRSRALPAMAGILENKAQLKRRIAMIAQFQNNSYRWSPLAVALIAVLCCISLPDARSGKAAQPASISASGEQRAAAPTEESNVFVDPQTGITFHKSRTISGLSDVIEVAMGLQISPNGKFLLSGMKMKVVPLDGGEPFDLVDIPGAGRAVLSPDGKKVAFQAGAIWFVPVNPETGRPTGPAEKLYEGTDRYPEVDWSPDSERITFGRFGGESAGAWTISVRDKSLAKVGDLSLDGKQSPDGKHTAVRDRNGLSVNSTDGGAARKIADSGNPVLWSADGAWLLYRFRSKGGEELRFFRLSDGREGTVKLPATASLIGASADQKKLFCYRPSYEWREALQVVSVAGGPTCDLGRQMRKPGSLHQLWSRDSKSILVDGEFKGDDAGLWALPLSGAPPVALSMDISVPGKIGCRQLSPNLDYVLFAVSPDDKTYDLWGAPVSWKQMRTTGPGVLVFKNWPPIAQKGSRILGIWSPDGKKVAIMQAEKGEIRIGSLEGGEPTRLGKLVRIPGPGLKGWPVWSPDSSMIAFNTYFPDTRRAVQVISASGGEAKTVVELGGGGAPGVFGGFGHVAWSPDGKALTIVQGPLEGQILSVSVSDGQSHPLANVKDIGKEFVSDLQWSPDGKTLAFKAAKRGEMFFGPVFLFHSQDGRITKIIDDAQSAQFFFWSPDGKWISHGGWGFVKTRPEGVLWEMDLEEALAKLAK